MDKQQLSSTLERLRAEIDRLEGLDEPTTKRLGALADDIALIDREGLDAARSQPILRRLEDEIARLEVTHPSLTTAMADIIEILTGAGI
jgi:Domain of unknown function (DUF4404)